MANEPYFDVAVTPDGWITVSVIHRDIKMSEQKIDTDEARRLVNKLFFAIDFLDSKAGKYDHLKQRVRSKLDRMRIMVEQLSADAEEGFSMWAKLLDIADQSTREG